MLKSKRNLYILFQNISFVKEKEENFECSEEDKIKLQKITEESLEEHIKQALGFKVKNMVVKGLALILMGKGMFFIIGSQNSLKLKKLAQFLYDMAFSAILLTSKEFKDNLLTTDKELIIIEDAQDLSEKNIEMIAQNTLDKSRGEAKLCVALIIKLDRSSKKFLEKAIENGAIPIRV